MADILFATLGTLGDVHPFLALANRASQQGYGVRFATSPRFRGLVESFGHRFFAIGADTYLDTREGREAMLHSTDGFDNFMSMSNLRSFESIFDMLQEAAKGAAALVSTPFVMAAHLVGSANRIPLLGCALSPASLIAPTSGSKGGNLELTLKWRRILNEQRQRLGLPKRALPQMERLFGVDRMLGLYPSLFGDPSANYAVTPIEVGYPVLRQQEVVSPLLQEWMTQGPFALFSFGSFVDQQAERFFETAVAASQKLKLRVLYGSVHSAHRLRSQDDQVRVETYLPHQAVMRQASVVVHHGGMGTSVQVGLSGSPAVVVPFGLDQPYNAKRLALADLAEVVLANDCSQAALVSAMARTLRKGRRSFSPFVDAEDPADRVLGEVKALIQGEPANDQGWDLR